MQGEELSVAYRGHSTSLTSLLLLEKWRSSSCYLRGQGVCRLESFEENQGILGSILIGPGIFFAFLQASAGLHLFKERLVETSGNTIRKNV